MSKHTPGPWAISAPDADADAIAIWAPNETYCIGEVFNVSRIPANAANARLIAAAPELLEALQALIAEYEPNLKAFATDAPRKAKWESACAIVAKATGEAA
jgi:hypothetical protein